MHILEAELQRLGFRRRSRRYWQCERGYELPVGAYLSIYTDGRDGHLDRERRCRHAGLGGNRTTQISAFHVTFLLDADNVHFYYHDYGDQTWEPGGHTSRAEIEQHGVDALNLRERADAIAARFAVALHSVLLPRR